MNAKIQHLDFLPPADPQLDLEIFSMADLRYRGKEQVRITHRYRFHALVYVTQGQCTQMVDFKSVSCTTGSLIVVRAGQAHNYGQDKDWDGWNLLFRPEFLQCTLDLEHLPEHMVLNPDEMQGMMSLIQQMRQDAQIDEPQTDVHRLLRHQTHALLTRLNILQRKKRIKQPPPSLATQRFRRFQQLVEERFLQWHQVTDYTVELGYTEKTLARAVNASTGMSIKAFITARIILEAKRLLVHTDMAVAAIAYKLGFDEPTNFNKFFKREVHDTPAEFRFRQQREYSLLIQ